MTCLLQSFYGALSGIALHTGISKLPLHFYFSSQTTQDYVQKPSNLRRKESKFHVYTLAREGTVSLGVFPHVNLIISSAVQGRLMLCQDTCTDPTGKSVLTPCKAVWQEQDQVREVHRMGDTVSHPYSVLLSTLPRTRKKEKEIKLKEKHNVMQSRFI